MIFLSEMMVDISFSPLSFYKDEEFGSKETLGLSLNQRVFLEEIGKVK